MTLTGQTVEITYSNRPGLTLNIFMRINLLLIGASLALAACTPPASVARQPTPAGASTTLHRVYDTQQDRFVDFSDLALAVSRADVAFLGEFHDDPGTHRLQAALLRTLADVRDDGVVLALEMFERDVQATLDGYLAGNIAEEEFLANSRPWPNYATDYRPMLEFAKAEGWPVVAGNVPRRIASQVARAGLDALGSLPPTDRPFVAAEHSCPRDEYWRRFQDVMGDLSGHGMQLSPEQVETMVWRTYEAQCVKDEAMAESVVAAQREHGTLVVHANGSFHSDYRLGAAARVLRRAPQLRTLVVTFTPVTDLGSADGRSSRMIADYIVFTLAPPRDSTSP